MPSPLLLHTPLARRAGAAVPSWLARSGPCPPRSARSAGPRHARLPAEPRTPPPLERRTQIQTLLEELVFVTGLLSLSYELDAAGLPWRGSAARSQP